MRHLDKFRANRDTANISDKTHAKQLCCTDFLIVQSQLCCAQRFK
ncbi:hypothetical protein AN1V17_35970 [Vallitalea sediminicola]